MPGQAHFNEVLAEAMEDFQEHGFDSAERLAYWQEKLRRAAEESLIPERQMDKMLRDGLMRIYMREVERGGLLRRQPGLKKFTVDKVKPQLRDILTRRIMASADLIKLNRNQEIEATLRRFSGWATSIPQGGTDQSGREEAKKIRKTLTGLSFRERRVLIDQGHKLVANVSNTVAVGGGAIAGIWRSHWKQANYDYREDHKERDGVLYVVRDNWAMDKGFMKLGGRKYTDEITQPGEEVFCQCFYKWVYNLRGLPEEMITQKGKDELERVRTALAA